MEVFDEFGELVWTKDERGAIARMKYDIPRGLVTDRDYELATRSNELVF